MCLFNIYTPSKISNYYTFIRYEKYSSRVKLNTISKEFIVNLFIVTVNGIILLINYLKFIFGN